MRETLTNIAEEFNGKRKNTALHVRIDEDNLILPVIRVISYPDLLKKVGRKSEEYERELNVWIQRAKNTEWHQNNLEALKENKATPNLLERLLFRTILSDKRDGIRFFGKTKLSRHEMAAWGASLPHIIAVFKYANTDFNELENLVKTHFRNKTITVQPEIEGDTLNFRIVIIDNPLKKAAPKK